MLHIAPDIGHAVCPVENTWYRGCLYTYMNMLYSRSWSISKFFLQCTYMNFVASISYPISKKNLRCRWSKRVGLEPPPNIVPYIKVFDIGCGKEARIGSSSEYRTYIEVFYSDIEIMTSISKFMISLYPACSAVVMALRFGTQGPGFEPWLFHKACYMPLHGCWTKLRDFYDFSISRNHRKMASISKSKTLISKSKLCFWY